MNDSLPKSLSVARELSPRRSTSTARNLDELVAEQLAHFGIDAASPSGKSLAELSGNVYRANVSLHEMWNLLARELPKLDRRDRIAWFNAKRFLCFQLAKLLDTLQNPFRSSYQSLVDQPGDRTAKGPYPIFDNVTAIFSATPVITRTATYLFACTEWIDDAFHGREMMLEVYSRLLNPTSISLANHVVDLQCGPLSGEYMAWNFNSGMAAIDGMLSHLVGHRDIVISSRNIYGGSFQLLHDWYQKPSNLDVAVQFFDGYTEQAFRAALAQVRAKHADRIADGKKIYLYLESPCNPHGYVLDVPAICRAAHEEGITVMLDSTVSTPFLCRPLMRDNPAERPDFLIESYTKDFTGMGTTTAGVVIARNERMFIPKGNSVTTKDLAGQPVTYQWNETLFWNVFYIKGAFLDADKAFEVINGSRTMKLRMMQKCVSTFVLARFLASHPALNVKCNAVEGNENAVLREKLMFLGLPAPLFTIDFERAGLERATFTRFLDSLEPAFGQQVTLGQFNTVALCPALTSHSEMSKQELAAAGITPTTIRIAVGDEDVRHLIAHFRRAAELVIEPIRPGFCAQFLSPADVDELFRKSYLDVHSRWVDAQPSLEKLMK
jgi:O-acetylhomoserine/O-acetylserine sulfhydrylase-like pyridoxal-dependent enzyme